MLDIKYIKENLKAVEVNNRRRGVKVDLGQLLALDNERIEIQTKTDKLRQERKIGSKIKPNSSQISALKKIGDLISSLESKLNKKNEEIKNLMLQLPNLTEASVPEGKNESNNKVLRKWGSPVKLNFKAKDHLEVAENLDLIDMQSGAKVAGSRFAYLKGGLVQIQFGLIQFIISILTNEATLKKIIKDSQLRVNSKPFILVLPPVMIKPGVFEKMGRLEPKEERYYIPTDDLYLIGSAEHTLGPLHMDSIVKHTDLPLRYLGYSTAFRREAGTYGKDTRGIFRVHQFDKLEIESFCLPEDSLAEQNFIIAIQEHLMQSLKIPYQVVLKCTGDMALPDYREIDIEAWLPSQERYRETHTADLMTDYQSRRLGIKVKTGDNRTEYLHMNDATAMAMSRGLVAIIENYQQADGSLEIPKVLQPFVGLNKINK